MKCPILSVIACISCSALCNAGDIGNKIREYIKGSDASIGVAVLTDRGEMITVNDSGKYPLMSVMKLHQAMAVADSLNRAGLPLSTEIHINAEELKQDTYSPLRDRYSSQCETSEPLRINGNGFDMTVAELIEYTLQLSDNNACDILFRHFGGPEATDSYIRTLGIDGFAITATEDDMHRDLSLCYENWSTPSASAQVIDKLLNGNLFGTQYRDFIVNTMTGCTTGTDRIVAGLQGSGAVIGHKTGTGDTNAEGRIIGTNDTGFVILPDGRQYIIAVLVKDSALSPTGTSAIIAGISETVYRNIHQILR